jgi:hypothetical protein
MASWAALGSVLAVVLACGASCSSSDNAGTGGDNGTAGSVAAAGTAGAAASAGKSDEGGSGGGSGAEFVDCTQLSPEACALSSGCVELMARLVSSPPGGADEPVGCVHDGGCSEVNITARDPQGREWAFPDTCIPAGWVGEGGVGNQ